MEWQLDTNAPIYSQLIGSMKLAIASGRFEPGERLPSVRDMAMEAGVNPNTMQRALQELERDGLVFTQRTAGRFVTEEKTLIDEAKRAIAAQNIKNFFDSMSKLGYRREEILALIESEGGEAAENAGV